MVEGFGDSKRDSYWEYWKKVRGQEITKEDPMRNVAKVFVLGLGYGMSHTKLDMYAKGAGFDLAAMGMPP
jgi:hypothetical protein